MSQAEALPEEAFDRLVSVEDASFWFRARNRLLIWALNTYFPQARSLLEVGCGSGYVLGGLARARPDLRLAGCDLSERGLAYARERAGHAELLRADATELPFREQFDVAGAFDVIEHVADDRAVLNAMRRAVRPGGGVIITVPQHRWLWSAVDDYSGHQRRYRRGELVQKLQGSGLRVRHVTSFVSLLLPLMFASRLSHVLLRRPVDPARELTVDPRLDRWLERTMQVEIAWLARGASLPAGGSLLAIAQRPPLAGSEERA
jgi:SAM-dependent methyltransferase